jgi:deoxyribonuclease V
LSGSFYKKAMERHTWNPSSKQAQRIQKELHVEIIDNPDFEGPRLIAGADVGFDKSQDNAKAAIVVMNADDLSVVEKSVDKSPVHYPYIPGLLSFREVPPLLKALDKLQNIPDVILCDSQGLAHPRKFGLACHLGVLTGIPTIGVAKSKLVGSFKSLPASKGSSVPLIYDEKQVGIVLRTRENVNPLFISIGHKMDLESAKSIVLSALTQYKLPETTRKADSLAKY